jgi:hypothetical protein
MDTPGRLARWLATALTRRQLVLRGLRAYAAFGAALAALLSGRQLALAAQGCRLWGGNTCNVSTNFCEDPGDANGCYFSEQGTYCPSTLCQSTDTSNCAFGEGWGYWDCCCNGQLHRCRDCGPPQATHPTCVCHAVIGYCPPA